eukprot:7252051-Prymnesium_polylepis.1
MMRRVVVGWYPSGATRAPRCRGWHNCMAYGLWCAERRKSSATRLCGASGWHEIRADERTDR